MTVDSASHHLIGCLSQTFEVGSIRFEAQPIAGMHASGRTTGIGVSVGSGLTQVMPVFNGISLVQHFPKCAGYMNLGLQDVDTYLLAHVPQLRNLDQFQVNMIKSHSCVVPDYTERGLPDRVLSGSTYSDTTRAKDVELPDGQYVHLEPSAWQCGELLFDPTIGGNIVRMDSDWHSVTASGGVAAFVAQKAAQVTPEQCNACTAPCIHCTMPCHVMHYTMPCVPYIKANQSLHVKSGHAAHRMARHGVTAHAMV